MSTRSGMGKSLYIQRLVKKMENVCSVSGGIHRIVTLHGPDVSMDMVVKGLSAIGDDANLPIVLHLDISERVRYVYLPTACVLYCVLSYSTLSLFQ